MSAKNSACALQPLDENDLGELLGMALAMGLKGNGYWAEKADRLARKHWSVLVGYYQRQLLCDVEVAVQLHRQSPATFPLSEPSLWEVFIKDHRPPKAPYTLLYRCDKCEKEGLKLWRRAHGAEDENGHSLLCAKCLCFDKRVTEDGRWDDCGKLNDQVEGWIPAVPVDDAFWGYCSVPSADVLWWKALPTYRMR